MQGQELKGVGDYGINMWVSSSQNMIREALTC